jgi:hypothetical protein
VNHTKRPGECVVIAKTRTLVSDRGANHGLYSNMNWGIEAGVPTLLPTRCVKEAKDLEILDVTEGVLPPLIDVNDSRHRQIWKNRGRKPVPEPDRPTLVAVARAKYGDHSLADAVVDLVIAGWSEPEAAGELVPLYDASFLRATVAQRPWVKRCADLLATGEVNVHA